MSGNPLRLKDLIPVTFTLAKDGDKRALIAKDVCCFCFCAVLNRHNVSIYICT